MKEYHYTFVRNGKSYHLYAPSKEEAIKVYLCEHELEELPKDIVISRSNM